MKAKHYMVLKESAEMMNYRKIPLCLLVIAILLLAATAFAGSGNAMSENNVPWQVESKARRLIHDLKKKGFEVIRGYFKLWSYHILLN